MVLPSGGFRAAPIGGGGVRPLDAHSEAGAIEHEVRFFRRDLDERQQRRNGSGASPRQLPGYHQWALPCLNMASHWAWYKRGMRGHAYDFGCPGKSSPNSGVPPFLGGRVLLSSALRLIFSA